VTLPAVRHARCICEFTPALQQLSRHSIEQVLGCACVPLLAQSKSLPEARASNNRWQSAASTTKGAVREGMTTLALLLRAPGPAAGGARGGAPGGGGHGHGAHTRSISMGRRSDRQPTVQ
jgi:hypothetical protein